MKKHIFKPRCFWLFHRWRVVHDTGFTVYAECSDCNLRKVTQPRTGYQPINADWLAGLETTEHLRLNERVFVRTWEPAETAPLREAVIVHHDAHWTAIGCRLEDGTWWRWRAPVGNEPLNFTPTHWMPLPEPPSA